MVSLETTSVAETRDLGRRIGAVAGPGAVLALVGDLGAGKTQFVKGIALGLGVADEDIVTSPTFVLMNSYEGRIPLQHYDLYRVAGNELPALGFLEFRDPSVTVIEWGEKAEGLGDHVRVTFEVLGESRRKLTFESHGPAAESLVRRANLSP